MSSKGMIHLYYGYGQGKTSAAMGLTLRALGHGRKVVIVQFLKSTFSGELESLKKLPDVRVFRLHGSGQFAKDMSDEEKSQTLRTHTENFQKAAALISGDACDFLVLDEVLDAIQLKMFDEMVLKDWLFLRPDHAEVVLTGHDPIGWLLKTADYVTEMVKHRHPYDKGILARKGIEY